jgi:TonB family protein
VFGQIRPPSQVRRVTPEYPAGIERTGRQLIVLEALIGIDGLVKQVRVANPVDPVLEAAAMAAVSQWQFTPTYLNCTPVEVSMKVTIDFEPKK